jgi:hypothetical protein
VPDIEDAASVPTTACFSLLFERGTGKGRTGRICGFTYRVSNKSENTTVKSAIITVPTSQGGK